MSTKNGDRENEAQIVSEDEILWLELLDSAEKCDGSDGYAIDRENGEVIDLGGDGSVIATIRSRACFPDKTIVEEIIDNTMNEDGELMDDRKARGIIQNFWSMF